MGGHLGHVHHWSTQHTMYLPLNKYLQVNEFYQCLGGLPIVGFYFLCLLSKVQKTFCLFCYFFQIKEKDQIELEQKHSILAELKGDITGSDQWPSILIGPITLLTLFWNKRSNTVQSSFSVGGDV